VAYGVNEKIKQEEEEFLIKQFRDEFVEYMPSVRTWI